MIRFRLLLFATLSFLVASVARSQSIPRTRYVKATASGTMDGSSWTNAMTLQSALDGYLSGDTLYLMKGSYTPTEKDKKGMAIASGEERNATFVLPSGITLYGGFAGTETSHTNRVKVNIHEDNASTIEGDIGKMKTARTANDRDNVKQLFHLGTGGVATLDGLTVARGHNMEKENAGGTGLRAEAGSKVTLRNCRFIGHKGHRGGAIFVNNESTITITGSTFKSNKSRKGGGAIHIADRSKLTIARSAFKSNSSNVGGAISSGKKATLTITRSIFENNKSKWAGAIGVDNESTLTITESTFKSNHATLFGGAIHVDPEGVFTVIGSNFIENTLGNVLVIESRGAAIILEEVSKGTISRCSFVRNSCPYKRSRGAVASRGPSPLDVSNCLFVGNSFGRSSAIYVWYTNLVEHPGSFVNNTVYNNHVRSSSSSAAVEIKGSSWVVANNIIYGNTGGHELSLPWKTDKTLAYNLIEGDDIDVPVRRKGALPGTVAASELFASTNTADANYLHLADSSLVRDAGSNNYIDGTLDLAGQARVSNTRVDIGAYEFQEGGIHVSTSPTPFTSSTSTINLSSEAGTITTTLPLSGAATDYTITLPPSGAFVSIEETEELEAGTRKITLRYTENTTGEPRTNNVVFSSTGGDGAASYTLKITQKSQTKQAKQTKNKVWKRP